jgi:hypothetical protein
VAHIVRLLKDYPYRYTDCGAIPADWKPRGKAHPDILFTAEKW